MDSTLIGGPELIILFLLFIFGFWWFLSFLPGKVAVTASALLVSFSPIPEQPPTPAQIPVAEREESVLL
jgi:hypothetical protein